MDVYFWEYGIKFHSMRRQWAVKKKVEENRADILCYTDPSIRTSFISQTRAGALMCPCQQGNESMPRQAGRC